jgi:uncharacterized protein (TIGR02145 family)
MSTKCSDGSHSWDEFKCSTCGEERSYFHFTDDRDGQKYKCIKIGNQIWMTKNLRYKTRRGCWPYDNDKKNIKKYGYLYDWQTAKKACPLGWHLPDIEEWKNLEIFLGLPEDEANLFGGDRDSDLGIGYKLKEIGTKHWEYPNENATNESGFGARGGGTRWGNGSFSEITEEGNFWLATKFDALHAFYYSLNESSWNDGIYSAYIKEGRSVRCIKDNKSTTIPQKHVQNEDKAFKWFEKANDTNDAKEKIMYLQKSIEIDQNYFEAYNMLGSIYENSGDNKRAKENYLIAQTIKSNIDKNERRSLLREMLREIPVVKKNSIAYLTSWANMQNKKLDYKGNIEEIINYLENTNYNQNIIVDMMKTGLFKSVVFDYDFSYIYGTIDFSSNTIEGSGDKTINMVFTRTSNDGFDSAFVNHIVRIGDDTYYTTSELVKPFDKFIAKLRSIRNYCSRFFLFR